MAGNPLTQYGYPSAGQLRGQAASLANAAVPTIGSINRQYGRQQENVTGFTNALVSALRGDQGAVGQGYNQALAQQQAIDSAAHAALSALGPQFAGVAVAQGGVGDSAASRLIANSAAAKNYAGQLPGVGASQGALAHTTLTEGQNQAIQTRNDAYRSALSQAFQQVQSNALARAQAAADIGLNQSKLAQQASEFKQSQAQSHSQFEQSQAQNASQFQQTLARQDAAAAASAQLTRQEYIAKYGYDIYTGKNVGGSSNNLAKQLGLTQSELMGQQQKAAQGMAPLLFGLHPVSFEQAIAEASGRGGINPRIAELAATHLFLSALANPGANFTDKQTAWQQWARANNIPRTQTQPGKTFNELYAQAVARYHMVLHWFSERLQQGSQGQNPFPNGGPGPSGGR